MRCRQFHLKTRKVLFYKTLSRLGSLLAFQKTIHRIVFFKNERASGTIKKSPEKGGDLRCRQFHLKTRKVLFYKTLSHLGSLLAFQKTIHRIVFFKKERASGTIKKSPEKRGGFEVPPIPPENSKGFIL